ncbi:SurA N-terminal domain-containing protein [Bacillus sp. B15-48]|uniref:SurA N-terminal domain-containing protein n=1 Tax=Bacillus sp. B15-48 TaxID=1548601 RepID=UPI00193FCDA4|nr:SurA N-terminal domain-containing protein [Bacillus sp. B15-48]
MLKRLILSFLLLGSVAFLLGACSSDEGSEGTETDVVATVNGDEILRKDYNHEFELTKSTYAQMGIQFDDLDDATKEELEMVVLNQLINTRLVLQSSESDGIAIEQNEIDTELNRIKSQFEDDQQYEDALKEMSITEEELIKQVREQLMIGTYFDNKIGDISVSEEDIQTLYNEYKGQAESLEQEAEPLETLKPQLEQQALAEKQNVKVSELIEELRSANEDNIEILL